MTDAEKYFLMVFLPFRVKESITGWFCTCKCGARTVGCCAHICSVVWFLGYARHVGYETPKNPVTQYNRYLKDAPKKWNRGNNSQESEQSEQSNDD